MSLRAALPATILLALSAIGCPKPPAEKLRPEAPTAAEALRGKKTCDGSSEYGKPLIVDLASGERGDLEVAMKEGVVVVSFDCNHLEVVPDCHASGTYGFMGFTPKEEMVRLESQDDLDANLPISAGPIGAKLGGEFQRGTTLDIALMMVGQRRTTRKMTTRGDLVADRPNACKQATHFVRGATLGAFAMATGAKAEARAAAELFGIPHLGKIGVGGGSKSSRDVQTKDGSLDACKGANSESEAPPSGCSALLRLELTVIDEGPRTTPPPGDDANRTDPCAKGFVEVGGKCTRPTSAAHLCKPDDYADCEKQCDAGNPGSCGRVGYYHLIGKHYPKDGAKAASFFQKACDAGYSVGCASLGSMYVLGEDLGRDVDKGVGLVQKACDSGDARYCSFLGTVFYTGNLVKQDQTRAARLLRLGCDGGADQGCFLLGELHRKGNGGLAKDPKLARGYYQKGCDGGDGLGCYALAVALDEGIGGPKDPARAKELFKRLCDAGMKDACKSAR